MHTVGLNWEIRKGVVAKGEFQIEMFPLDHPYLDYGDTWNNSTAAASGKVARGLFLGVDFII
jgi:hypothetical protein